MKILSHNELRERIMIAVMTMPRFHRRALHVLDERAVRALADLLMERIFASTVTVRPSMKNPFETGRFGVTEPHPFPDLIEEK